jgi:hypothetical protein
LPGDEDTGAAGTDLLSGGLAPEVWPMKKPMNKKMAVWLAGIGALVVGVSVRGSVARADEKPVAAAVDAQRQALVGIWKVNAELSDDPRAKMREGRQGGWGGGGGGEQGGGDRGGGRGGGGGWGGGRGGGMGRGGGGWGGGRGGGMGRSGQAGGGGQEAVRPMLFTASQITVTNLTPEVTILDPDGGIRRLHADDKGYRDPNGAEVKARWDEDKLVVDTKTERGHVKETWAVTSDPRRLSVLLEIDRPFGGSVKVKRVFDAVEKDAPKPDATTPEPSKPAPGPDKPNPGGGR